MHVQVSLCVSTCVCAHVCHRSIACIVWRTSGRPPRAPPRWAPPPAARRPPGRSPGWASRPPAAQIANKQGKGLNEQGCISSRSLAERSPGSASRPPAALNKQGRGAGGRKHWGQFGTQVEDPSWRWPLCATLPTPPTLFATPPTHSHPCEAIATTARQHEHPPRPPAAIHPHSHILPPLLQTHPPLLR